MDRFHEVNAFIAVVEAGGFSAAARRTGDSQSVISKAVGALEKRLGVMLLNRSTRSVTLTDQAAILRSDQTAHRRNGRSRRRTDQQHV